jgi:outer membrane protein OmpA-like peptidoglycan-associated protein
MKKLIFVFAGLLFFFALDFGSAEVFRFKYSKGDTYRILSTVSEDVWVNGVFNNHTEIVNRSGVTVTETVGDRARHEASFMVTQNSTVAGTDEPWAWGEEYKSVYTRDQYGKYTVSDQYFLPTIRDVPVFSQTDIPVGGIWEAQGEEAHDLRGTFNINKPFKVPFNAQYTYTGAEKMEDNRTLHVITAQYTMEFEAPRPPATTRNTLTDYPAKTTGYSHQTIFWDNDKGAIDHYYEDFRIVIETSAGNVFEFTGKVQTEVTDYTGDRARVEDTAVVLQAQIDFTGIENVTVAQGDRGLTFSIENINFAADSDVLRDSEKKILDTLADLLEAFPNNDLLVTGHTARAGSVVTQQELSERRAKSIADYLISQGVLDAHRIFTRGLGSTKPIATNNTEAGRAKNRRVEITVLEN